VKAKADKWSIRGRAVSRRPPCADAFAELAKRNSEASHYGHPWGPRKVGFGIVKQRPTKTDDLTRKVLDLQPRRVTDAALSIGKLTTFCGVGRARVPKTFEDARAVK